jgi:hypothetical protein
MQLQNADDLLLHVGYDFVKFSISSDLICKRSLVHIFRKYSGIVVDTYNGVFVLFEDPIWSGAYGVSVPRRRRM